MRKTGAALCAGLVKVMEALVTVAEVVVMFFVCLWQASRWDPTKWQLDIERLVEEAQRAGLCTYVYLEHLRTEGEPLRAKVCEPEPSTRRVGVAFVPESKALRGWLGAPQLIGGERMRTILSAVPRPFTTPC